MLQQVCPSIQFLDFEREMKAGYMFNLISVFQMSICASTQYLLCLFQYINAGRHGETIEISCAPHKKPHNILQIHIFRDHPVFPGQSYTTAIILCNIYASALRLSKTEL